MQAHSHVVDGLEELQGHTVLHARRDAGGRAIFQLDCGWVFYDASASWRPGAEELEWLSRRVAHHEQAIENQRADLDAAQTTLDAFEDAVNAQENTDD
jgi:hypothetical protein